MAKHIPADKNGVRIAELDEMKFRRELWEHQPLTDFWRVGRGITKKLEENGITFYKDNCNCWKNKIYYWCKYKNNCVCFISIKDPDEPQNLWTVWSNDIKSECLENYDVDNNIKELAWKYIDHCGHCGSCGGGQRKVVFGREFKAVCGCTFRVDNPSFEDLAFLKKIIEMSICFT